jgi:hypothetical protein
VLKDWVLEDWILILAAPLVSPRRRVAAAFFLDSAGRLWTMAARVDRAGL